MNSQSVRSLGWVEFVLGFLLLVGPSATQAEDRHYFLLDTVRLPNNGTVTQFQVADIDGDGLDEIEVIFRDSYYAYSFSRDSLISQDHQTYLGGTAGIIVANWDSDPEPEVLLKDLGGRLWLKENAMDTGFVVVDTVSQIGSGYLGAPGATMVLRDMNGDGFADLVVSQLSEYYKDPGRYYETEIYHTGDIGVYDLHNNIFLWRYSSPFWILPPTARSAEYSACFGIDEEGTGGVVAWGQRYHSWWERGSMDYWVQKTNLVYDLSVYGQTGSPLFYQSSPTSIFALAGDLDPAFLGQELVVLLNGPSLDSAAFPHASGPAIYSLNFSANKPILVWARECDTPAAHAMFWYDSSKSSFAYCRRNGDIQIIRSSDLLPIGILDGISPGLETKSCRAVSNHGPRQLVQVSGNVIRLYGLQDPTGIEDIDRPHVPGDIVLYQNYPNPFNPSTTISFEVPKPGRITLTIINSAGQIVRVLEDRWHGAGRHTATWDGKDAHGLPVASGIYFYRIKTNEWSSTKKMSLVK